MSSRLGKLAASINTAKNQPTPVDEKLTDSESSTLENTDVSTEVSTNASTLKNTDVSTEVLKSTTITIRIPDHRWKKHWQRCVLDEDTTLTDAIIDLLTKQYGKEP